MITSWPTFSTSDGVPLKDGETSYNGVLRATLHVDVGETKIVSELVAGQVTKLYQMQTTGILHTSGQRRRPYMLDNTEPGVRLADASFSGHRRPVHRRKDPG
jgi:hypothetical protein